MTSYRDAGVDLEAADAHVDRIAPLVTATWGPEVVGGFGGFAGGVEIPAGVGRPVLMLATDGVGTKLELARRADRWEGVGFDLVAMCVDDLAAAGASPIAFVDYLAVGKLDPEREALIVASVAGACRAAGCALVGGETAEHPGVMASDQVDLAGTALGVVERGSELDGSAVRPGDVICGIESPNLRANGFSLVRRVLRDTHLAEPFPGEGGASVAEVVLRPSVIYAPAVLEVIATGAVHGAAHITGGGLPGNLVRPLPDGCRAVVDRGSWTVPHVFGVLAERGDIDARTMAETFNLGIGFCLIVDPGDADHVLRSLGEAGHRAQVIGEIVDGERGVELIESPAR